MQNYKICRRKQEEILSSWLRQSFVREDVKSTKDEIFKSGISSKLKTLAP